MDIIFLILTEMNGSDWRDLDDPATNSKNILMIFGRIPSFWATFERLLCYLIYCCD